MNFRWVQLVNLFYHAFGLGNRGTGTFIQGGEEIQNVLCRFIGVRFFNVFLILNQNASSRNRYDYFLQCYGSLYKCKNKNYA